jgi:hypothetical protein
LVRADRIHDAPFGGALFIENLANRLFKLSLHRLVLTMGLLQDFERFEVESSSQVLGSFALLLQLSFPPLRDPAWRHRRSVGSCMGAPGLRTGHAQGKNGLDENGLGWEGCGLCLVGTLIQIQSSDRRLGLGNGRRAPNEAEQAGRQVLVGRHGGQNKG